MKTGWILLPALLMMTGSAWSMDIYCNAPQPGGLHENGEIHVNWYVVNYNARRAQLPGETKPPTGCAVSLDMGGQFYRPIEIIKAPSLGEVATTNYAVAYRSAKNGQDTMSVRVHWLSASAGKPVTLIIHFNIQVTDKPL